MIELSKDDVVLRFWVAGLVEEVVGREGDWMAVMFRRANGTLEMWYRFRYHAGPGFDDGDESSWYQVTGRDEAALIQAAHLVLNSSGFEHVHEREVNGPVEKMFAIMMDLPGWKIRMTPIGAEPLGEKPTGGRRA